MINNRPSAFLDLNEVAVPVPGGGATYSPYLKGFLYDLRARHGRVVAVARDFPRDSLEELAETFKFIALGFLPGEDMLSSLYTLRRKHALNMRAAVLYSSVEPGEHVAWLAPEVACYAHIPRRLLQGR